MSRISATMVADSLSPYNTRLSSIVAVMPRIILAELNTHRALSKNSASSRAIPSRKMLQMVMENPFIPIAWQKEHSGMQGTEYYDQYERFNLFQLKGIMFTRLLKMYDVTNDTEDAKVMKMFDKVMSEFPAGNYTLTEMWLMIRDKVVSAVVLLYCLGVTKQIANRLLEPFMWHTVLISGTEWQNFFELRCPQYIYEVGIDRQEVYLSRKGLIKEFPGFAHAEDMFWFKHNKGQAEIHMMALAEAIFDCINESTPKKLKVGEWHIPFGDKIDLSQYSKGVQQEHMYRVAISTAMSARTSYTIVGDEKEIRHSALVGIHDKMAVAKPFHASPFEHASQVPSQEEYAGSIKGYLEVEEFLNLGDNVLDVFYKGTTEDSPILGWFRNFRGFKQYRQILEEKR